MAVTVPSAGDSIAATWGADVANRLNRSIVLSSDQTRAAATYADITGLTFSVTNGVSYTVRGTLWYTHSDNTGGPIISQNHPGGTVYANLCYRGETSASSRTDEQQGSTDSGSGVATVDNTSAYRLIEYHAIYDCTADGTYAMRFARNTAGTLTIKKGSRIEYATSSD